MVVADALAPYRHQDICSYHAGSTMRSIARIRSRETDIVPATNKQCSRKVGRLITCWFLCNWWVYFLTQIMPHGLVVGIKTGGKDWTELTQVDQYHFNSLVQEVLPSLAKFMANAIKLHGNPSHKSHNALDKYPTMQHFVTEMCTFLLQNVALWDMAQMHSGICEMGLLH